ncbi:MAG: PD-(D/E)XK motif protein [Planctomycetaceae bacterium]
MSGQFTDLVELFDSLPPPDQNVGLGRFCAHLVPACPACSIGKDIDGCPALLIGTDNAAPGPVHPLVLESFRVMHMVSCRVQERADSENERTLSVVQCTTRDRVTQEYFLRALYPIIASLPARPNREDVTRSVDRLLELFRQMSSAPRRAVSGLWAELFVISEATSPEVMLRSWRAIPEEKFDFSMSSDRVDVKSSAGTRVHYFNLDQLRPLPPLQAVVVSLLVERAQGGANAIELVEVIRNRVHDSGLLLRLDQIVAETIGQDWRSLSEVRFSVDVARASLRTINAGDIPSVSVPIPPELSSVHFKVDLTAVAAGPCSVIPTASLFLALPTT